MPLLSGNFLELKDSVFIRGFPSDANVNVCDVRNYFQERVGKCCVEMTALSKDKGRLFIALKFDSVAAAENAIERFNGKYIFDHKVQLNFWRAPKNMVHSGRFQRKSYDMNNRRWDDKKRFDEEVGESLRHRENFSREKNSWNTNHMPRDTVCYNEQEELHEESDDLRGYQQRTVMERYETNDNFSYQEQSEEYSKDHWSSDGGGEGRYAELDDKWNEWDSDFRGSNENLSEREYYERDEEFSYPRGEEFWQEREADQGRRTDLVDQGFTKDYDDNFFECGDYLEFNGSHHDHNERLSLEEVEDNSRYRGDNFCPRNDREWFGNREFIGDENRRTSPPSDQTRQWPRWETVAPSNQTREPSNLDVVNDAPQHVPWAQDLRPCNKFKDLTSRNPPAFSEGRPRSDEWLRNTQRNFRGRSRHSASPVNFRPKTYGHRGSPLVGDASSQTRTDSARSRRGRISISPVRNRRSANGGSTRSSSVDKSSDFKPRETSPTSGRLSHSCSEQGLGRKKRESRSYSPSPSTKIPLPKRRANDGKEVDLRRSLMIHQQRKHLSLREGDRGNSTKHPDRRTRTSPDKPDKSLVSCSTGESSSFSHATNRKRRKDGESRQDERTKRRKQTSVCISENGSTESENGNNDSTRNRRKKEAGESKKQSPRDQKRKTRQRRDPPTNNSNTKRADRFLSNLAATLAKGKVSTKRPGTKVHASKEDTSSNENSVERRCTDSKRGHSVNPTGQSEGARPSEKRHQEQNKAATHLDKSKQSPDIVEDVSCDKLPVEEDSEGEFTTSDKNVSNVEVSNCNDCSDQEVEKEADCDDSSNLFEDNSENADPYENNVSSEDEALEINKNCSFIVDTLEDNDILENNTIDLDGADECDNSSDLSTENSDADADLYMNTEKIIQLDNLSSDEVFSKINKNCSFIVDNEGNKDTLEVNNIDLRGSTVSELRTKMDFTETLTEEEKKTCRDDQQTSSDESFGEPSLKEEMKEYTESGVSNETMSTNGHHGHMKISPAEENLSKSEEGEETYHPNERGDVSRRTIHEGDFLQAMSRPKVLADEVDNQHHQTNHLVKDRTDGSVCQNEEHQTMQQSKDSCQEVDMEFSSDDTSPGITSSTKVFRYPVLLTNTGYVDKQDDKSAIEMAITVVTNPDLNTSKVGCCNKQMIDSSPTVSLPRTIISSVKVNSGPFNQGSYNKEEPNYNGSRNLAACTTECQHVLGTLGTMENMEKRRCVCKNDNQNHCNNPENLDERAHRNVKSCDLNPHIDYNSNVKTETNSEVLQVQKLEDSVKYTTCNEKVWCKREDVYILEGARVTQQDVYRHNDVGYVYNLNSEEYDVNDAKKSDGSISDQVYMKGISNAEQEMYKGEDAGKICLEGDGGNSKDSFGQEREICNTETKNITKTKVGTLEVSNVQEGRNSGNVSCCVEVTPSVKEGIHLVTEDFQHVDMEISSDEEIQDGSKGLSTLVDNDTQAVENDEYRPYSPSSPTWTSEEHRSPLPKEDLSLYSPSHPTNVSESDAERSITIEDGAHEDGKDEDDEPICDSMDVDSDEPEKENFTINSGSTGGTLTTSCAFSSSPKSGSELFQRISIPDDINDDNLLSTHLMPNHNVETYDIKEEGHGKDTEVLSDNSATEKSFKDNLKSLRCQKRAQSLPTSISMDAKPKIAYVTATKRYQGKDTGVLSDNSATEKSYKDGLMSLRCQKRTQSFPTSVSMDAKPKLAYVTAAKTYFVYTNSGTQHKPRIFYATNDTSAGPVRSLSLDTALGKCWPLAENSTLCSSNTPVDCEQEPALKTIPTVDTERRREQENPDSRVGPVLPNGPFSSGAPLIVNKDTSKDGDQDVTKVGATFDNFKSNNMALLPDLGPDNCADCGVTGSASTVNTESTVPLTNSDDIILPTSSDPENKEPLVIQTSVQSTQKDVPVESSRSTLQSCESDNEVIQAPFGTGKKDVPTENHHSIDPKLRKIKSASNLARSDISNMSYGPVETSVTSVITDKRPLASVSENCGYGNDDEKITLPKCSAQVESTVPEMQCKNAKNIQGECLLEGIQQQAPCLQTAQAPVNSTSKSANNKRPHSDSLREASRPCKVARKPLKLIIPTNRPPNPGVKRTADPGRSVRHSKSTSTSTITCADVQLVAEKSPSNIMLDDRLFASEPHSSDKDVFTENDPSSGNVYESKVSPSSMTNCPLSACKTGNTSLLTTNLATYNQTRTIVDNNNVKEHTAKTVSPDDKASCSGKESDWVALKMERLRKKKEEIEQVYKQECHTVINVVKMLVSNDPRLEGLLQNAVRRTLQEMGRKCVQELERQARPGT